MSNILLNVNGIEVIYNHVILVLKGVSLQVPEGSVVALLGGNGAGKTTTLRAVSNLLAGERGEVTKGSIELRGERIEKLSTAEMVQRGVIQVMEGRHCFAHLTIEDNLMAGAYTRKDGKAAVAADAGQGLQLLSAAEDAAHLAGRLHLGRRAADVRHRPRADGQPEDGAAGRTVDGPGAADRRGGVRDRASDLNSKEKVTFLLAEQNTNMALRYADHGYILESGRIVMEGAAKDLRENEDVKEFYLGMGGGDRQELQGRQELQAPQALAGVTHPAAPSALPPRGRHERPGKAGSAAAACSPRSTQLRITARLR